MGEIADSIYVGLYCQVCIMPMEDMMRDTPKELDDVVIPGYPRTCPECLEEEKRQSSND